MSNQRYHLTLTTDGRPAMHGWWANEATARSQFTTWIGAWGELLDARIALVNEEAGETIADWPGQVRGIRFVGGSADGRTFTVPNGGPPPIYLIPTPQPIPEPPADSPYATPTRAAEYEPLREDGWLRRADDGAYLYELRRISRTCQRSRS
ncbi:hypothetical protein [Streptomyces mirabilis]|uniref:hypothetical protein n=1 Tax=Streptomyces mirabilis TaxID=68239 RepID=UPI003688B172